MTPEELAALVARLERACVASCGCLTKSPDIAFHDEGCRYRVLCDTIAFIGRLGGALAEAREDAAELQGIFDLQCTRMAHATLRWREATGKHNVSPDLGHLLDWLMCTADLGDAMHQQERDRAFAAEERAAEAEREIENLQADIDNDSGNLAAAKEGLRILRKLFAQHGIDEHAHWPEWLAAVANLAQRKTTETAKS